MTGCSIEELRGSSNTLLKSPVTVGNRRKVNGRTALSAPREIRLKSALSDLVVITLHPFINQGKPCSSSSRQEAGGAARSQVRLVSGLGQL